MPGAQNLDAVSVVDGKLIREMPSSRLDGIIARGTERVARLTERIAELRTKKNECQAHVDQAIALKAELAATTP